MKMSVELSEKADGAGVADVFEVNSLTSKALLNILTFEREEEIFALLLEKRRWFVIRSDDIYTHSKVIYTSRCFDDCVSFCKNNIIEYLKNVGSEYCFDEIDVKRIKTTQHWTDDYEYCRWLISEVNPAFWPM